MQVRDAVRSRGMAMATAESGDGAPAVPVSELQRVSLAAAVKGSEVVWDALDKPVKSLATKSRSADIVTETDRNVEAVVREAIATEFPGHAILGEEGGLVAGDGESEYLWCVDPLDGTTNFAHGYPSFAVSVGVLHRGRAAAGSVVEFTGGSHCWSSREFTAGSGSGAFCNGERISVSATDQVDQALLVSGFGYNHDAFWELNLQFYKHFTDVSRGVRRLGAASVDLCHVALGITEAYYEFYLKPWDVCAGTLMVREAGGKVTTLDGRDYTVFDKSMLASNGKVHGEMLEHVQPKVEQVVQSQRREDIKERWFIPPKYNVA